MAISADTARGVLQRAELIISKQELSLALDDMAQKVEHQLGDKNPLVLVLMTGGLIPASEMLLRMRFPLELDYIHATRYGDLTQGTELRWIAEPKKNLAGRHVLIIDDILDEGQTLAAIIQFCHKQKAASVSTAVLVEKIHTRKVPNLKPDYCGATVPDRYVFGFGMDYKGFWRNLPEIYAADKKDE
ncbi:MAG: hypoxanthine-guanine phosphoribosyltransferase [Gammaproteobacteria bacterium]|nr:hypoxanthine-guanine phosphoribosyltransferase [Gammaproteobacteria bacterium]